MTNSFMERLRALPHADLIKWLEEYTAAAEAIRAEIERRRNSLGSIPPTPTSAPNSQQR